MMRRPPGNNYGYQPLNQNPDSLEEENQRLEEDLSEKIKTLKSLTIDIGDEVRNQDKILNELDDDVFRTGGFISNTIGRVTRLSKTGRFHTCYMLLFALLVFFILYLVLKFR